VGVLLLVLLLALVLGGLGFAIHLLWIVAAIVLIFWLVGFGLGRGHAEGPGLVPLVTRIDVVSG